MESLLRLPQRLLWVLYEDFEQTPLPVLLILAITTAVTVLTAVNDPSTPPFLVVEADTRHVDIHRSIPSCAYTTPTLCIRKDVYNDVTRWLNVAS